MSRGLTQRIFPSTVSTSHHFAQSEPLVNLWRQQLYTTRRQETQDVSFPVELAQLWSQEPHRVDVKMDADGDKPALWNWFYLHSARKRKKKKNETSQWLTLSSLFLNFVWIHSLPNSPFLGLFLLFVWTFPGHGSHPAQCHVVWNTFGKLIIRGATVDKHIKLFSFMLNAKAGQNSLYIYIYKNMFVKREDKARQSLTVSIHLVQFLPGFSVTLNLLQHELNPFVHFLYLHCSSSNTICLTPSPQLPHPYPWNLKR